MKKTINTRKWVFLPIEVKSREMQSRLLIASELARRGYGILLGKKVLRGRKFPGIVLFNSFGGGIYKELSEQGNKIIVMDEESIVRSKGWIKERFNSEKFKFIEFYVSPGHSLSKELNELSSIDGRKILTLGNPRIDLLGTKLNFVHDKQIKRIKKIHKDFILVNTAFPYGNFLMSEQFLIQQHLKRNSPLTKSAENACIEEMLNLIKHYNEKKENFLNGLMYLLKSLPEVNFVLRPHPGENPDFWKRALKAHKNIKVVKKYNVIPWIKASDLLIQSGCTTAVEAFALKTPCISMELTQNNVADPQLPKQLSLVLDSSQKTCDFIKEFLRDKSYYYKKIDYQRQSQIFEHHVEYNKGESFKKICDQIDKIKIKQNQVTLKKRSKNQSIGKIKNYVFSLYNRQGRYEKYKVESLSISEITKFIESYLVENQYQEKIEVLRTDFNQYLIYKASTII
jgi:surface carbohydrate biosynthesis protein